MSFTYGVPFRPISFATVPPGYVLASGHKDFRFGTVTYANRLSDDEQRQFELVYIPTDDDVDALVAELLAHYRAEYSADELREFEPGDLTMAVGAAIDRRGWHIQRADITTMLEQALGRP